MGYKVLIVEDEDVIRRGLSMAFNWLEHGCTELLEAADGQEAIEKIRAHRPDIVLLDINMPFADGLEVLERTQKEYRYTSIVLTGYAEFEYARRAMAYDAVAFLLKPVDFNELHTALEKAIVRRRSLLAYEHYAENPNDAGKPLLPAGTRELSDTVRAMLDYVQEHHAEKLTVKAMAADLHYSENFLIRRFKEEMHLNFTDYLNRFRIQKATQMIRARRFTMQEISSDCGFTDYKYFKAVFKRYMCCSPREYAATI